MEPQSKLYRMLGVDTAVELLRPKAARWEYDGRRFTIWQDPRPCPTIEEMNATMEKIKAFEDSIETIWLPDHYNQIRGYQNTIENAIKEANK